MAIRTVGFASVLLALLGLPLAVQAESDPHEEVAAQLVNTTVTMRSVSGRGLAGKMAANTAPPVAGEPRSADETRNTNETRNTSEPRNTVELRNAADNWAEAGEGVTVCSGVSVAKGVVVTCGLPLTRQLPAAGRFRVTLPGGEQSKATLRVVDHYSSLSLFDIEDQNLPILELSLDPPSIGASVMTAAAAGIEKPVVSLGIVGALDRSIGSSNFPPLLQCDVRTTETSSGAAIVDRGGKLIGIIVATTTGGEQAGWAYAVPALHIRRLLEVRTDDKLVVLERRRPTCGLTLGQGAKEGTVEVEHVVPGGPADQVGIHSGDLIVEADGRKIRSAYQAVDLLMNRQPGDKITLVVQQGAERKSVEVTLGGAGPAVTNDVSQTGNYAPQQVNVRVNDRRQIEFRNGGNVSELNTTANGPAQQRRDYGAVRSPGDEVGLLKSQLTAFDKVIVQLKDELRRRDEVQMKTDAELQELRGQLDKLRRDMPPKK